MHKGRNANNRAAPQPRRAEALRVIRQDRQDNAESDQVDQDRKEDDADTGAGCGPECLLRHARSIRSAAENGRRGLCEWQSPPESARRRSVLPDPAVLRERATPRSDSAPARLRGRARPRARAIAAPRSRGTDTEWPAERSRETRRRPNKPGGPRPAAAPWRERRDG